MPTLIVFQFNSSVPTQDAASFRRRLHGLQTFRMCADDEESRCMELPTNTLVADYDDPEAARSVFESEARRSVLLSAMETVLYVPYLNAVFQSLRMCSDSRCLEAPARAAAEERERTA